MDSREPLYCDLSLFGSTTYFPYATASAIVRFNDLLPPLLTSGRVATCAPVRLIIADHGAPSRPQCDLLLSIDGRLLVASASDLRFAFFLCLFPQLLVTHHLIHRDDGGESARPRYEWIQTDAQLRALYHRVVARRPHRSGDVALSFEIRPRSDTKSDSECIENHALFVLDNLRRMDRIRAQEEQAKRMHVDGDGDEQFETDDEEVEVLEIAPKHSHDAQLASLCRESQTHDAANDDSLIASVIRAIHAQHEQFEFEQGDEVESKSASEESMVAMNGCGYGEEEEEEEEEEVCVSVAESGLCAYCECMFSERRKGREDWIGCDFCGKWFHAQCAGLSHVEFKQFQSQDEDESEFKCLLCRAREKGK